MGRRMFNDKEIEGFFKDIELESEIERNRILSLGLVKIHENNKEITSIFLDHSTGD